MEDPPHWERPCMFDKGLQETWSLRAVLILQPSWVCPGSSECRASHRRAGWRELLRELRSRLQTLLGNWSGLRGCFPNPLERRCALSPADRAIDEKPR